MPLTGEYEPSTQQWVREQVEEYEGSGGTADTTLRGVPVVVITSMGAQQRQAAQGPGDARRARRRLRRGRLQGRRAGAPAWYRNLSSTAGRAPGRDGQGRLPGPRGQRRRARAVVGAGGRGLARLRRVPDQDRPADPGVRARARGRRSRSSGPRSTGDTTGGPGRRQATAPRTPARGRLTAAGTAPAASAGRAGTPARRRSRASERGRASPRSRPLRRRPQAEVVAEVDHRAHDRRVRRRHRACP